VLYLVDVDLRSNRFLDGMELQKLLPSQKGMAQPWDLVITSPLPSLGPALAQMGAKQAPTEALLPTKAMTEARCVKEQLLLEGTIATLHRGGSVLIPATITGSVPELLLLFDSAWEQDRQLSSNYPVVWLSSMGDMVLDQIKTRLEWMGQEVLEQFDERAGSNPFMLKNVKVFHSLEDLCMAHPLARPKVIIAASPDLESGDARELFIRLAGEPLNLLWLMGVPPDGTLGRNLLNDFVLQHAAQKDMRLLQCLKEPLPEDQLRAFYEAKIQELLESGGNLPHELAVLKAEFEEASRLKAEDGLPPPEQEAPTGASAATATPAGGSATATAGFEGLLGGSLGRARQAMRKGQAATFWSPFGWSNSRTLSHNEVRPEADEYGHLLTSTEVRTWKAQDQGSETYGLVGDGDEKSKDPASTAGPTGNAVKTEPVDDDPLGVSGDWRESLRIHFPEPMKTEIRERMVRVACRVRFLPETTMDLKDLYMMLRVICPKHVVMLPASDDSVAGQSIAKQFRYARPQQVPSPEMHVMDDQEERVDLTVQVKKRKLSLSQELLPRLRFFKSQHGAKVARLRARLPEAGSEHFIELAPCNDSGGPSPSSSSSAAVVVAVAETEAEVEERPAKLPRHGALLLSQQTNAPLNLSSLQDQLRKAGWSRDDVQVDFRKPRPGRSWSSRILETSGGSFLGWTSIVPSGASGPAEKVPLSQASAMPMLSLEGVPGEDFFTARRVIYKKCALI